MTFVGSTERRQRQKAELRQTILDAARDLFVASGEQAVTMRKIAEAIEYSPTAIYLHFKDKDTLIRELCSQDFSVLARRFVALGQIDDPVERMRRIAMDYVKFAVEHPNQYRFMFMTPHQPEIDDEARARIGNPNEDSYAFLTQTVGEAIDAGRLQFDATEVDLAAQLFWGAIHGPIALQLAMENDEFVTWRPLYETCERLIGVLLDGCARAEH